MDRRAFDNPPLTLEAQFAQLQRRGMTARDPERALQALAHLHDSALTGLAQWLIIGNNTPAMPLTEAHFGGFFVSGSRP